MKTWKTSEIADGALWLAIVLAPVAGGGSSIYVLPVLAAVVCAGYSACILEHHRSGSRIYIFGIPVGLSLLAAYTLIQIVPLPAWLLGLVSPRALEVRVFFNASWAPISYEPAASARDAARLLLYAMTAFLAADRVRARKSYDVVAIPVIIAGVTSLLVAFVQRMLDADRMLGILPSMKPASKLLTTFVNPNHASAFLLLVAMTALGQALAQVDSAKRRVLLAAVAAACAIGSALCFSRGGLIALGVSFVVFFVLALRHSAVTSPVRARAAALLGVTLLFPIAAIIVQYDELVHAFAVSETDPLGVAPKIAAVKDALPLVMEHPLLGIGRGSYVSVYPAYKTAAFQLTFTHPENIVAQLISDWGVLVGGGALIAFVLATYARVKAASTPVMLAACTAILVITAQNLVDFNLELPGMAIPVAALLGGATPKTFAFRRIWPKERATLRVLIFVPIFLVIVGTGLAFRGDLDSDQHEFDLAVRARRLDRSTKKLGTAEPLALDELAAIAAKHPANPAMAAQLSYLSETAVPPDNLRAMRWANRALMLAPTYADGHLAVGRMLVRTGHRAQGFMHMRRGWSLASDERRVSFIQHAVTLANSTAELREAIPRRDDALDILDETQIARCARVLHEMERDEWATALIGGIDPKLVPSEELAVIAEAASQLGQLDLAAAAASRRISDEPADEKATRVLLDVLWKKKDTDELNKVLDLVLSRPEIDPTPFLRMRIEAAVRQGQVDTARATLDLLRRKMSPTLANQVEAARLDATIESKDNQPARAVRALDRAIQLAPTDLKIRMTRAKELYRLGRVTEVRADLTYILKAEPKNRAAAAMLEKLDKRTPGQNDDGIPPDSEEL